MNVGACCPVTDWHPSGELEIHQDPDLNKVNF